MTTPNALSKARAQLLLTHPFFATLAIRTPMIIAPKESEHRAWTDGTSVFLRQDLVDSCSPGEIKTIVCHEISHNALMHLTRMHGRNPDDWNRAADYAINLMLQELDLLTPLASVPGGWLCDAKYKGMSAEQIYDDLQKQPKDKKPKGGDKLHGDLQPPPMGQDQRQAMDQKNLRNVAAAANIARMQGKLHGSLARMVGDILEPSVPWYEALRSFMIKTVDQHDDWGRRNRHYGKRVYLPVTTGERMGPLILIGDTSGSMGPDELRMICSEIDGVNHQVNPESIRVVWADTKVAGEQVFEPHEFEYSLLEPQGGGGTDMRVPMQHVEQYDPLVVILATDGYTLGRPNRRRIRSSSCAGLMRRARTGPKSFG